MRILFVIHVGETLGHLVRGLSVANELSNRGANVEIACATKTHDISSLGLERYKVHPLRWNWSHNSCEPGGPSPLFLSNVLETVADLQELVRRTQPDAVVGMPGFATSQIAQSMNIPHFCVMHGPYLSPVTRLTNPTPVANAVLARARAMCQGPGNAFFQALTQEFALPKISYDDFLSFESIFCAQPGIDLDPYFPNILPTAFIVGSLGPSIQEDFPLESACYLSFGSGNPCDLQRLAELTASVFPHVIVSTGKTPFKSANPRIYARPLIADAYLAGRVQAVVCHAGIGTVGAFASCGTPLLLVPTELDQAVMTVHAVNMGIARECGLESVSRRTRSGRRIPEFSDNEFLSQLQELKNAPRRSGLPASGAEEIASAIVNPVRVSRYTSQAMMQDQHA